jgi:hypothetical protein
MKSAETKKAATAALGPGEQGRGGMDMTTYRNISEAWGDAVGGLTVDDYRRQALVFGIDPSSITADDDHVYADGQIIGDAE